MEAAKEAEVRVVALTDHDTVAGIPEAWRAAETLGLEFVPGIEFSAYDDEVGQTHLLGYFVDHEHAGFAAYLEEARQARARRASEMVERLNRLGLGVSMEEVEAQASPNGLIARPHVARALVDGGWVRDVPEAFDRYITAGGPAYVPTRRVGPEEGIRLIHEAGGVAVLAHGARTHGPEVIRRLASHGLDGLEIFHPDHGPFEVTRMRNLADELGLLETGGSDWHGFRGSRKGRLGAAPVPYDWYVRLRDRGRGGGRRDGGAAGADQPGGQEDMTEKTDERRYELVIVGAGPAGLTAGLYAKRSELDAVLLERGVPGGQLLNTELIDDYPGLPNVGGPELAELMTRHATKFGLQIDTAPVSGIKKLEDGEFRIGTEQGVVYRAPAVILTAGGTPTKLAIPGEEEYAGKGVSYCAICDGAFFKGETIAVVGGGDAATEEADFLTRYVEKLYLIHRRDELRAQKILQKRVFENPKIEIIWNTVIEEVLGDATGMKRLQLRNTVTHEESYLEATGLFVFIGFRPNTGLLEDHAEHDSGGYLITDRDMRTSIPGLFVAGDVRAQLTRQITTAVGDATTATIAAEKYLTELKERRAAAQAVTG